MINPLEAFITELYSEKKKMMIQGIERDSQLFIYVTDQYIIQEMCEMESDRH